MMETRPGIASYYGSRAVGDQSIQRGAGTEGNYYGTVVTNRSAKRAFLCPFLPDRFVLPKYNCCVSEVYFPSRLK
ncbi:hypothetical protein [Paenibacillus elgii]|uniref:hypothetical protein n=1 Tax=Paenibacillus elgii TaxID=189691 RepID=UPI0012F926FC|nr:hypothetical protein [Paenibacillus elgii]